MSAAAAGAADSPLAIICGSGTLPFAVADAAIKRGRKVVLFAVRGAADAVRVAGYPHQWGALGQFGRLQRLLREAGCRDVVFIGGLVRPGFWQIRFDLKTLLLMPRIARAFRGGDNHLLSGLARIFEQHGFRLLGAHEVAPEILVPEGVIGSVAMTERDRSDVDAGLAYLRAAGPHDVGQAVVVSGGHVLAVEAIEGTDHMLARVAELRASGRIRAPVGSGVLVKAPKPQQDRRFDLPSIGPQTVEEVARAKLAGIAVVAGETIIAEPQQVIAAADDAGIFVAGVRTGSAR
ncbi:MAG TPA: UDP-2,3-diacylglucosamine diphosphatase LpxI [Pseudolabrys sp.]|nr:UDP-2,3-diacylglucosamine diphosphatase LpxI [Pseudolabrys sp.]